MNNLNELKETFPLGQEWQIEDERLLKRVFEFKGFLKTMSFVNAVAWEANKIMHHPDMEVSFNRCVIKITTHDQGNQLTELDFKLAQAIDQLF